MIWIVIAIIGYFLNALANILDKYILSTKISQPSVYAFFVAMFSLFAVLVAPFGLRLLSADMLAISLLSGAFFVYGLVFFYRAVRESEISRVAPLLGVLMALLVLLYAFMLQVATGNLLERVASGYSETILAFWLLLIGGFLIAFDLPLRKQDTYPGIRNVTTASLFMIASLIMLKYVYSLEGFVNGFVWSRLGLFLGGLSLLLVPSFRREIITSLHDMSQSGRKQASVGLWFILNKVVAALGNVCVQYAIFLGSLVAVQALSGLQFAFVFLLAIPLSLRFPSFFQEKLSFNDWLQKALALALIGLGVYFTSLSGTELFV